MKRGEGGNFEKKNGSELHEKTLKEGGLPLCREKHSLGPVKQGTVQKRKQGKFDRKPNDLDGRQREKEDKRMQKKKETRKKAAPEKVLRGRSVERRLRSKKPLEKKGGKTMYTKGKEEGG